MVSSSWFAKYSRHGTLEILLDKDFSMPRMWREWPTLADKGSSVGQEQTVNSGLSGVFGNYSFLTKLYANSIFIWVCLWFSLTISFSNRLNKMSLVSYFFLTLMDQALIWSHVLWNTPWGNGSVIFIMIMGVGKMLKLAPVVYASSFWFSASLLFHSILLGSQPWLHHLRCFFAQKLRATEKHAGRQGELLF